jgi:peptidoglycan/xylan/chitin deacetylase (PgdA/CDA1 family)
MSKRGLLAGAMRWSGLLAALERWPSKPGILVVTHHRIGDAGASRFDRGVFSATAEQLDAQVKYFKRHYNIVGGEELEALVLGKAPLKRLQVAITFDDGYLDNYTAALDVLRANDASATFFLVPPYVGTGFVPWWDEIAYLVRNTRVREIVLTVPEPLTVPLGGEVDREAAIHRVLRHFKHPANRPESGFMEQLREQAQCSVPAVGRRFLDWDEARAMQKAGMTIGSHTMSHPLLGQLTAEQQRWELEESKKELEQELGVRIASVAYPVGSRTAFSGTTEGIAKSLGYTMGFSFYGGMNVPGKIEPMNLLRGTADPDARMFRTETAMWGALGRLPY